MVVDAARSPTTSAQFVREFLSCYLGLATEPVRLAGRYTRTNPEFLVRLKLELARRRFGP
jgi:hypothetical protein